MQVTVLLERLKNAKKSYERKGVPSKRVGAHFPFF
jgi:hypothetical protein